MLVRQQSVVIVPPQQFGTSVRLTKVFVLIRYILGSVPIYVTAMIVLGMTLTYI